MINEGTFSEAHRMILTTFYEDTKRPTKEEIYSIADSLNRKPDIWTYANGNAHLLTAGNLDTSHTE